MRDHYAALNARRGAGHALFALEHDLSSTDLREIHRIVAETSVSERERHDHWLLWVVHATEVAYSYAGDQYWQSFETQTRAWDHRLRPWIRDIFGQFASGFGGPTPTGSWAAWFTIIAWPITNAVLPTDLQRHLARALYQARQGLATRLDNTETLGEFVAAASWEGSDRFQQLKEQPRLLGQIALALLRPAHVTDALLLRSTLARIAADLQQERSAAGWLRSARRSAERPVLRLTPPRPRSTSAESVEDRVRQVARLTSPRLALRPDRSGEPSWSVWLTLPNLAPIAAVAPQVRTALLESRCWAPGAELPIARGRLLRDRQEIPLPSWPKPGLPLVRFEGLAAGLEAALLAEWSAPRDPVLFALSSDGLGRFVASRIVRAGKDYVVGSVAEIPQLRAVRVKSTSTGCHLYLIRVPSPVSGGLREMLRGLGLLATKSALMWPAGDIPIEWDGESLVRWSAADLPMLGFRPDHDLLSLSFDLRGGTPATLRSVRAGSVVFVAFPGLQVGVHELTVREVDTTISPVTRSLLLEIGEYEPSPDGTGPLLVWAEPHSVDLEELWNGAVAVCIRGAEATARMEFSLAPKPGAAQIATKALDVEVPLGPGDWKELFVNQIVADASIAEAYDRSRVGHIVVSAGRFGDYRLEFERSIPPLRWHVRHRGHRSILELDDDTDSGIPPTVSMATFQAPDQFVQLSFTTTGIELSDDGGAGLYRAQLRNLNAVTVLPPRLARSLSDLRLQPAVQKPSRTPSSLVGFLDKLDVWSRAALPGHALARHWRAGVVRAMHDALVEVICGEVWLNAERQHRARPTDGSLRHLRGVLMNESPRVRWAVQAALVQAAARGEFSPERLIPVIEPLVRRSPLGHGAVVRPGPSNGVAANAMWLSEFCLRLATDAEVFTWAGPRLEDALEVVLVDSVPVRLGRYLAVSTTAGGREDSDYPPLVPGWRWR